MKYKFMLKIISVLLMFSNSLLGQDMVVPAELQGVLFKKIFFYVKTIKAKDNINVLVIYSDKNSKKADELVQAFQGVNISANAVRIDQLNSEGSEHSVAYFVTLSVSPLLKENCVKENVLSISGFPSLVEDGDVSIALDIKKGRPQIVVNMERVKAEGHDLSADLLKLSKIIK